MSDLFARTIEQVPALGTLVLLIWILVNYQTKVHERQASLIDKLIDKIRPRDKQR